MPRLLGAVGRRSWQRLPVSPEDYRPASPPDVRGKGQAAHRKPVLDRAAGGREDRRRDPAPRRLYSSALSDWRQRRRAGAFKRDSRQKKRMRDRRASLRALSAEVAACSRNNARLMQRPHARTGPSSTSKKIRAAGHPAGIHRRRALTKRSWHWTTASWIDRRGLHAALRFPAPVCNAGEPGDRAAGDRPLRSQRALGVRNGGRCSICCHAPRSPTRLGQDLRHPAR